MNVQTLEAMTVDQLIEFVTEKKESQPVEIVKGKTTGFFRFYEDGKEIGYISSQYGPDRIQSSGGKYEVIINEQICFTGSLRMAKAYAKSKLWK